MQATSEMEDTFTGKAELVSARVSRIKTLAEAFAYTVALCDGKEMCPLLVSGCELNLSEPSLQLCREKTGKIIAAPNLDPGAVCGAARPVCRPGHGTDRQRPAPPPGRA